MSIEVPEYSSFQYFRIEEDISECRSYNPLRSQDFTVNKSQFIVPLSEIKSNTNSVKNEDEKSFTKMDISQLTLQNKPIDKQPIIVKAHRSLFPEILNKKVKSEKSEITVYYFNTCRKLIFTANELSKKFMLGAEKNIANKEQGLIRYLIPYLVKQYCKLYLYFEPLEVNHENFQLKIAGPNGEDDPIVDPFSHEEDLNWLFGCGNLFLGRKPKDYERLKIWQKNVGPEMEILQIIIPFQREIIQHVEKAKTLNSLKQKLISSNQLGNIVIVTYTNFTVCEFKKKISDIAVLDKILEVYKLQPSSYQDIQQKQPTQTEKQTHETLVIESKQIRSIIDAEFEVSNNLYYGRLYIQIIGAKIIEKYEGGLMGFIWGNQRRVERSIHTLVALSCEKTVVNLKFLNKGGAEICVYDFQAKEEVETFFKCLMRIGRELKQNFEKISN